MKSTEFITEAAVNSADVRIKIAENIKRDCQPFLKSIGFPNNAGWLYRGMAQQPLERYLDPFAIRKDRRPLHTAAGASSIIDNWMHKKFGWYPRSQGLFAVSNVYFTEGYGATHIIFPIGDFGSVWSENIDDMTYRLGLTIGTVAKSEEASRNYEELAPKIIKMLEAGQWHANSKISEYLKTAPDNEIMINATSYYAVPVSDIPIQIFRDYLK